MGFNDKVAIITGAASGMGLLSAQIAEIPRQMNLLVAREVSGDMWAIEVTMRTWTSVLASVCLLAVSATGLSAERTLKADPSNGEIVVETDRYSARFEAGTLVYLYNKPKGRAMVDVKLNPEIKTMCPSGLYVQEGDPTNQPFWIVPALEGAHRSTVTIKAQDRGTVTVTFGGLVRRTPAKRFYPDASVALTVSIASETGDLLVQVSGTSPETRVIDQVSPIRGS